MLAIALIATLLLCSASARAGEIETAEADSKKYMFIDEVKPGM